MQRRIILAEMRLSREESAKTVVAEHIAVSTEPTPQGAESTILFNTPYVIEADIY